MLYVNFFLWQMRDDTFNSKWQFMEWNVLFFFLRYFSFWGRKLSRKPWEDLFRFQTRCSCVAFHSIIIYFKHDSLLGNFLGKFQPLDKKNNFFSRLLRRRRKFQWNKKDSKTTWSFSSSYHEHLLKNINFSKIAFVTYISLWRKSSSPSFDVCKHSLTQFALFGFVDDDDFLFLVYRQRNWIFRRKDWLISENHDKNLHVRLSGKFINHAQDVIRVYQSQEILDANFRKFIIIIRNIGSESRRHRLKIKVNDIDFLWSPLLDLYFCLLRETSS